MPSPFQRALATADAVLDNHMGETVQVTPMKRGDFEVTPDPARAAFDVIALVTDDDPSAANITSLDARVVHEQWRVEVRRELLAGRRVVKGDHIILLERVGSPTVSVTMVERLDERRVAYLCGPVRDI